MVPTPRPRPGEFDLIRRYFAPLAEGSPGALGLTDDAALLTLAEGRQIVLTTDTIVEGVHYPTGEDPADIARRLLRVNLSDLAAMGARPEGYLLNLALTPGADEAWIQSFASALGEDQRRYGARLLGGDTVNTSAPAALTLTAIGSVGAGRALQRSGARPGDDVYVSGTIGDGVFGLWAVQNRLPAGQLSAAEAGLLAEAFRRPDPRLELGQALSDRGLASAAADVSDGLLADLGHICEASGVGATVFAAQIPLSPPAAILTSHDPSRLLEAVTGGDDYELVFTARPDAAPELAALAREIAVPLAAVGHIEDGAGVALIGADGRALRPERLGFEHR